jgi:hypothetical protein
MFPDESSMTTGFASDEWDELVLYIQNRQVIPVVGPELITIECDGARILLTRWLAPRLAEQLKLTGTYNSLNEVAGAFLLTGVLLVLRPDSFSRNAFAMSSHTCNVFFNRLEKWITSPSTKQRSP